MATQFSTWAVHEVLLESFGVKIKNASKLGKRVKQGIFED
jgi:hypothetical protein